MAKAVIKLSHEIYNEPCLSFAKNASAEQKMSAQMMIEANQRDLITLENSPLKIFKSRIDEILAEREHATKLQHFEELRSAIESGRLSADLGQLRTLLVEIDEGIFGFVPDTEKL